MLDPACRRAGPLSGGLGIFVFFSNRLGCLGSLAVTALGTAILLVIFRLIN
jgi:hypothetical protein